MEYVSYVPYIATLLWVLAAAKIAWLDDKFSFSVTYIKVDNPILDFPRVVLAMLLHGLISIIQGIILTIPLWVWFVF